jgi:hypothetical protein
MAHLLQYQVLEERLAVCQLVPDARIPAGALESKFFCLVRTGTELSLFCTEDACPENHVSRAERGWVALKLKGPFPFSMTGVLASFVQPLAEARVGIFAVSTFDTDYVLVKRDHLQRAVSALRAAGHQQVGKADNSRVKR